MKRNRRNNNGRERMLMIFSSAFVLAALTMSGLYLRNKNAKTQNDGYNIDFTALESTAPDKYDEIAWNKDTDVDVQAEEQEKTDNSVDSEETAKNTAASSTSVVNPGIGNSGETNMENDLDYMPLETDSHTVENLEQITEATDIPVIENDIEASGLVRPVSGEVLLPYSMDSSVYFATLDQYKYNPAVIFQAEEGYSVLSCAEGRVVDIYEDAEIGRAVRLDLGNGYEAIYGQLREISVVENGHVNAGDIIGTVATPTKYYSVEGSNLYFALQKDGVPVNPEGLFQ